jgi:hypothetical protein
MALVLRYPVGHEAGVDSYFMHAVAGAIVETGSVGWFATPLSYLGLAPLSYSPGIPLSLAAFSEIANVSLEPAILAVSLLLGLVTPWTAFLLGKSATGSDRVSLFLAFLVTSAAGMVQFTDWTISARGAFLVVTPLALALFINATRASPNPRSSMRALAIVLATLVLIHALWLLLIPLMGAAWLALRLLSTQDAILRHRLGVSRRAKLTLLTSLLICAGLLSLLEFGPTQARTLQGLPAVGIGIISSNLFLAVGLQYATVVGLGILLFPLGVYRLSLATESKRRNELIALLIVFLPISLDPVYGILVAIPAILLASALTVQPHPRSGKDGSRARRFWPIVAAFAIGIAVIGVPPLVTIPRSSGIACQQTWSLDDQTYNAALYTKYLQSPSSTFAWDDSVEAGRLEAISGIPAVEPLQSLGLLEYPWLERRAIIQFTNEPSLVESLIKNHQLVGVREWLPAAGLGYDYYWGKHTLALLQTAPDSPGAVQILNFYDAQYAVQRCPDSQSTFYSGLDSSRYLVFADEKEKTFRL